MKNVIKCSYSDIYPLEKLIPNPRNDNDHKKEHAELLAKVMKARGVRHPIIVSKNSGFIVAGHLRLMAAKINGYDSYPVDIQEFENEAEEYAFLSSDNNVARYAEFNETKFLENLKELKVDVKKIDFGELGLLDFKIPEVEFVGETDEDEVPEVQHDPVTKRGDVWLLGNHRVMCGDSTMVDDVDRLMNGEKADMAFTDPPYGLNINFDEKVAERNGNGVANRNAYKKIQNDENTNVATMAFSMCRSMDIPKLVFWGANYYTEVLPSSKCWVSWYKKEDLPGDTFCDTELAWTNCEKHSKTVSVNWKGMIKEGEEGQKRVHPNQKPVLLAKKCFDYLEAGNSILDLFLGSGSTLIACEKTKRKCYGMEIDEHYCDVIIERWQKFTGKEAVLESSGKTYNSFKKKKNAKNS